MDRNQNWTFSMTGELSLPDFQTKQENNINVVVRRQGKQENSSLQVVLHASKTSKDDSVGPPWFCFSL